MCKNGEFPESLTIEEMSAKLQNTVAVSQALETFKDKFRMILSLNNAGYGDDNFNSQFNLAVEESVDFFYSKISLGSNDAVKSFEDALRSDCASYFHEHCVPINLNRRQETNTAAVTHAQRYFNMKFHDFLSSARAGTGEESFEGLFDFHFNCAVNIFHDNRCSESASSVQAYIDALNRDCRTHFEENCKPLNQRLRHERNTNAVGLALENFKQEFHEFLSSDEAGIEDEMFSEMEPRALYSAEQVFQRNRSSGSDASIQSYLNNLREACHRHFLEECVPMNQSLRLIWQLKVGLITVVGVGTIYAAGTMVAAETAVGAKALAAKTTTGGETNAAVRQYLSTETVNKLISSADRITVAAAAVAGIFSKLHTASNHNNNN
ncbi:unnamed protein product [Allacma fusca]|uniref:Uncharacterized protein n=1 Tax=Allacma fusca TaxID=39272 RepID=A0A8J2J3M2_9HEXA|nr:unnamed protein product [Allacma fusca]